MPVKMTIRSFEQESSIGRLRIGIAGLGLMGGSLAMALRGRVSSIVGYEKRILTRQIALREGIVDEVAEELLPGEPDVDLLVLATPVRNILDTLGRLPQLWPAGCPVIDLGSTKQAIVRAMDALPDGFTAIGGHPMCGRETAGLASAAADLYRDQLFVLCPSHRTTRELESTALALIESVGGHAIRLDAAEHDEIVAVISHLPSIAAAALMQVAVHERQWRISASGFRDASRLAGTDPKMLLDVLMTNRAAILTALNNYTSELIGFRDALEGGEEETLFEWLAGAQMRYAAFRRSKSAGESPAGRFP